jgi:hypothetical protein
VRAAIEGVPVDVSPGTADAMTGAGEGRFSSGPPLQAARLVVAAWVTAVNGDESALRELAELALTDLGGDDDDGHDAAYDLLHPVGKDWVIAPDPEVTGIELPRLGLSGDVPELSVEWRFAARQRYGGPVTPPGWMGSGDREYVGSAFLTFDASRPFPWRIAHGFVQTVDEYCGYRFESRDETPEEYWTRTGSAGRAAALRPGGTYRLVASFAEHDHRFGDDATADVESDVPPTRDEAVRLAQDAIDAAARQRTAQADPGDRAATEARPSPTALQVIRLLAMAPPVEPAAGPDAADVDAFARRYAASRGLGYPDEREPAWREPGPWFLAGLNITRSHGLMTGGSAGGPAGEVWYAEGVTRRRRRSRERWIVARYVIPAADRAGGIAVAVARQRGLARGGPSPGLTEVPRGLRAVAVNDERLARRYLVAAAGGNPAGGARSWADRLLTADFAEWLLDQPYGDRGAEATCFQLQGGLVCVYAAGWPGTADALDAFRDRAARIAAAVQQATRSVVQ